MTVFDCPFPYTNKPNNFWRPHWSYIAVLWIYGTNFYTYTALKE